MTDPGAEMKARAREEFAELVGSEQFYQTQESAMAPGIADGWPEIIKAPHTKNGRLKKVKTQELFDRLAAFAAKEVARATQELEAWKESAIKLLPLQSWGIAIGLKLGEDIHRKVLPALLRAQKMEESLARAVEEERMAIAKIACSYCRQDSAETQQYEETPAPKDGYLIHERKGWTNSGMSCGAKAIHERSQLKGEG